MCNKPPYTINIQYLYSNYNLIYVLHYHENRKDEALMNAINKKINEQNYFLLHNTFYIANNTYCIKI